MRILLFFSCVFLSYFSASSATYYAVADGAWSDPNTWSLTQGAAGGAGVPGAGDTAYTEGFEIGVDGDITVANIGMQSTNNTPGSPQLYFSGIFSSFTITVTNQLQGVNAAITAVQAPTEALIEDNPNLVFRFTGTITAGAIASWSYLSPLNTVEISGAGVVRTNTSTGFLAITESLTITSGSFRPGRNLEDISGSSILTVSPGTTLDLQSAGIVGTTGTSASSFNEIVIDGTVSIPGSIGFMNANTIRQSSAGILNVNSTNANLTQGWWFTTTSPAGTVTLNGTVSFGATGNQNVPAYSYSTISLAGSGTKTVISGGSFTVAQSLAISNAAVTLNTASATGIFINGNVSNSGTWSPVQLVKFSKIGNQIITGNTIVFGGGIEVGDAATTPATVLDIADNMDVNGAVTIRTNASLDINAFTISIAGNLVNNGSLVSDGSSSSTVIFDGVTTMSGTSTAAFPNVSITGTLNAPPTLTLGGNLSSSGTFNSNNGTIQFTGSSTQSITGTITVNNLTVNKTSGGVTVNGTVNLDGTFTLTSGTFNANSGLIIRSTGAGTGGRIAALSTPSNFSGNVTIQRYVPSSSGDFRYLSFPLVSGNLSMWRDDFSITGAFADATTPAQNPLVVNQSNPSVFRYDAPTSAWVALAQTGGGGTASVPMNNLTGYSAYTYSNSAFTISISGQPVTGGPYNATLSSLGGGFNLVGNPYPSAIDWDNFGTLPAGLSATMYLRRANNSFASYNQGAGTGVNHPNSGWGGEIALGQAFWVQATSGTPSLTFNETVKTGTYTFIRKKAIENLLRIKLEAPNLSTDETIIYFNDEATFSRDDLWDGEKLYNSKFINLSSYNFEEPALQYVFNGLPPLNKIDSYSVGLQIKDVPAGVYTLTFSELESMNLGYTIVLIDKFLNTETLIENEDVYAFSVTDDPASLGKDRLEIQFRKSLVTAVEEMFESGVRLFPSPTDGKVYLSLSKENSKMLKKVTIFNVMGDEIASEDSRQKLSADRIEFDLTSQPSGVYIMNIVTDKGLKAMRFIKR